MHVASRFKGIVRQSVVAWEGWFHNLLAFLGTRKADERMCAYRLAKCNLQTYCAKEVHANMRLDMTSIIELH